MQFSDVRDGAVFAQKEGRKKSFGNRKKDLILRCKVGMVPLLFALEAGFSGEPLHGLAQN